VTHRIKDDRAEMRMREEMGALRTNSSGSILRVLLTGSTTNKLTTYMVHNVCGVC